MPLDLPMSVMFIIFLALFVLFGTSPVLPRLFALLGKSLRGLQNLPGGQSGKTEQNNERNQPWRSDELNDYEIILLRKLAMIGGKGLSRKGLINSLYFKPSSVDRALQTLHQRGLIRFKKGTFFGVRFQLTTAGTEYARRHDLLPRYLSSAAGKGSLSLLK